MLCFRMQRVRDTLYTENVTSQSLREAAIVIWLLSVHLEQNICAKNVRRNGENYGIQACSNFQ